VDSSCWRAAKNWETGVNIHIRKKGHRIEHTNYHGISLLSTPGKVYVNCLEKNMLLTNIDLKQDTHSSFFLVKTPQIKFSLIKKFQKPWDDATDAYACFLNLENAYDWVAHENLRGVLRECSVDSHKRLCRCSFNLTY